MILACFVESDMLLDLEIFDITIQVLVHSLDLITECLTPMRLNRLAVRTETCAELPCQFC